LPPKSLLTARVNPKTTQASKNIQGLPQFLRYIYSVLIPDVDIKLYLQGLIMVGSVGIATDYGLDGPGIESQWG
jgi:hypothetical protein